MWTQALLDHPYPWLQWGTVLGASLAAAVIDLRSQRIPNLLTIPLFLTGLVQAGLWGGGFAVLDSFVAACALMLPYVLLFVFAGGGAGDAKLMGGIGAWLGLMKGALALGAVCVAGILLAFAFARSRGRLEPLIQRLRLMGRLLAVRLWLRRLPSPIDAPATSVADSRDKMPYGAAIGAGVLLASTSWFLWLQ